MKSVSIFNKIKKTATAHNSLIGASVILFLLALAAYVVVSGEEVSVVIAVLVCILSCGMICYFGYVFYSCLVVQQEKKYVFDKWAAQVQPARSAIDSGAFVQAPFAMGQTVNNRQRTIDSFPNPSLKGSEEQMIFGRVREFKKDSMFRNKVAARNVDDFCREPINGFVRENEDNPVAQFEQRINAMSALVNSANHRLSVIKGELFLSNSLAAGQDVEIADLLVNTLHNHLNWANGVLHSGRGINQVTINNLERINLEADLTRVCGSFRPIKMEDFGKVLEQVLDKAEAVIPRRA